MLSITWSIIVLSYFIFFHNKVLDKLGLTERDNKLIFIGAFFISFVEMLGNAFRSAGHSTAVIVYLVLAGVFAFLMNYYYKRL